MSATWVAAAIGYAIGLGLVFCGLWLWDYRHRRRCVRQWNAFVAGQDRLLELHRKLYERRPEETA